MEENNYRVFITTSGIGSRLGTSTKYTNKSLVTLGNRAVISQIIESYPEDIEFVITIGYFGNHVRDYVTLAYPNRNITFVNVDNYDGPGSSLVYSMLQAREYLQCPFIFHACDTIVLDKVPAPATNWLGGNKNENSVDYRSLKVIGDDIQMICEKGEQTFDYVYIGLAGIKNWKEFWQIAEHIYNNDTQLSDCNIITQMITDSIDFKLIQFENWYDIGNVKSLQNARKHFKKSYHVLDKENENLYVFDEYVIKFFYDKNIVKNRIIRSKILHGLVPENIGYRDNFYKYKKVYGNVLSKTITEDIFEDLLIWAKTNLWDKTKELPEFYENCRKFYYDKTSERLACFYKETNRRNKTEYINECEILPVPDLLKLIPDDFLCSTTGSYFHGDFILSNVIYNNGSFTLIDFRQDFAGNLEYGDAHYDLAKLYHNLIFSHELIEKNLYEIEITSSNIHVEILRKDLLCKLERVLFKFINDNGFDERKIRLLTPLIWINMSGLHEYPLNLFLYYWGRYNLFYTLKMLNLYK